MLISNLTDEASSSPSPSPASLKSDERGLLLIHLLLNSAAHVSANNLPQSNSLLEHLSLLSSPHGDPIQRLSSYFSSALARRLLLPSFPGLYRALSPPPSPHPSSRRLFLHFLPFLRLSSLVSNQAISESILSERLVHLIDLGASDVSQWLALLRSLSSRPDGPPHLRFTVVAPQRDLLRQTAAVLSKEAEKLDIPFQFNAVVSDLDSLDFETLGVKTGEAVVVSSVLQLHSLLASDDDVKMESFLASLWSLAPKVVVVTEQESNHNGASLNERFVEALNFYAAMFDCLESMLPRQSAERLCIEKRLFGEEIGDIVGCEGVERRERHEKVEKWGMRFEMAGFGRAPLSYYGMLQARRMLQGFGLEGFRVREENGCFLFCWQDRALFSVSAWKFRRFD